MKKTKLISVLTAAVTVLFGPCWSSSAQAAPPVKVAGLGAITNYDPQGQCQMLFGMQIMPHDIGLPTQGAMVDTVTWHPATDPNGEYCQVMGHIRPVDSTAPDI